MPQVVKILKLKDGNTRTKIIVNEKWIYIYQVSRHGSKLM